MKQKIKLTKENDGTIHVDDVDVSKGVYFKWDTGEIHYILLSEAGYFTINPRGEKTSTFFDKTSFLQFVNDFKNPSGGLYTLSGLRIVTEKELSVEDLRDIDHVAFITNFGNKFFFTYLGSMGYAFLSASGGGIHNAIAKDIQELIKTTNLACLSEFFRFSTRSELYAWLAE